MEEISLKKWENLNRDCLAKIFEAAGTETLICCIPLVCKNWHNASLDPYCWQVLNFKSIIDSKIQNDNSLFFREPPIYELVKFAVDRSQGTATKVVLGYLHPDFVRVMTYISVGCPRLKTLILPVNYPHIFGEDERFVCISKLIKKWRHLEHLTVTSQHDFHGVLNEISTHCPNFASLTSTIGNSEAAKSVVSMLPNVKSLTLPGSCLRRRNLILILSKCRELKLLDVRTCQGFDADDAEILEMASHIETFLSTGSTVSYDYNFYGLVYGYDSDYSEDSTCYVW